MQIHLFLFSSEIKISWKLIFCIFKKHCFIWSHSIRIEPTVCTTLLTDHPIYSPLISSKCFSIPWPRARNRHLIILYHPDYLFLWRTLKQSTLSRSMKDESIILQSGMNDDSKRWCEKSWTDISVPGGLAYFSTSSTLTCF